MDNVDRAIDELKQSVEHDDRVERLQAARKDKVLLGRYYLSTDDKNVTLDISTGVEFDLETFGACMVVLVGNFIALNPDVSSMEMMSGMQRAMQKAMYRNQEGKR